MDPINAAIQFLESKPSGAQSSCRKVAAQFNVDRRTLSQRHKGQCSSYATKRKPASESWVTRFLQRHHQELKTHYTKGKDRTRHKADSLPKYKSYFQYLHGKIRNYHVRPSDIYNMDEKGFHLGRGERSVRIFSRGSWDRGGRRQPISDGIRDSLPPSIIYQAASSNIQERWTRDIKLSDDPVHVTSSPSGWSNNDIGLAWLEQVSDRYTMEKAGRALADHIERSQGLLSLKKGDFYSLFKLAWDASFTVDNILSSFSATGIYPMDPEKVLKKETHSTAILYPPRKIRAAAERRREKGRSNEEERLRKLHMRDLREANRLYNLRIAEERRVERERLKKVREEEKAQKAADREAQKINRDARKAIQLAQSGGAAWAAAVKVPAQAPPSSTTRRGRIINTPGRYR
ncbi:hypothetical protein T440DRAFT_494103 [Plenodomus tracheiphilus IPT5]|uniref:HTH CENPB-type domain-containing protein n=1 Tax=Plenodomus tracheiphilus IPT5 TaxID=1408161 RepID=A0A6A7APZ9_9PLEO|nr:hypothetical protein T440DRAFT_494103 [Plenodomus tracheiphilus IPT5]